MLHILERFCLHFVSSTFLTLGLWFFLRWILRTHPTRWLSSDRMHLLITAGLVVAAIAYLREPWDVSQGQTVLKATTDCTSWYSGVGVSIYGIYRSWKV